MKKVNMGTWILIVAVLIVGSQGFFIADETRQIIVTQFGRAVGKPIQKAGLNFLIPFIQKPNYFPKNLLEWDGDPGQIPTLDKTFIWVDTFARWRITDPLKFFETVNNPLAAHRKLDDIIDPATRNAVTSFSLLELVRNSNRKMDFREIGVNEEENTALQKLISTGRESIVGQILREASPKLAQFGIEIVDVRIKRINYVEEVLQEVYGRMIAERKQIAEKFRSEGKGEAFKIEGDKEKELKRITSEAYRTAEEVKGRADGEATRIYAQAYQRDPEFYSFLSTLKIYEESLNKDSELIMTTNGEFFKYLKKYKE